MAAQRGFFDAELRLEKLSQSGDLLEKLYEGKDLGCEYRGEPEAEEPAGGE